MVKTKYYLKTRHGVVLGVVKVNEESNVLYWNEIVRLLNQLYEENEQLQKENKEFKQIINFCTNEEEDALVQVIRENEQLRQQNNELKLILKQHEFAEKEGFK